MTSRSEPNRVDGDDFGEWPTGLEGVTSEELVVELERRGFRRRVVGSVNYIDGVLVRSGRFLFKLVAPWDYDPQATRRRS